MGAGFGWAGPGYEILEERKGVVFGAVNGLRWLDRAGLFRTGNAWGACLSEREDRAEGEISRGQVRGLASEKARGAGERG